MKHWHLLLLVIMAVVWHASSCTLLHALPATPRTFVDFQFNAPTAPPIPPNWNGYTQSQAHAGATISLVDELGAPTGIDFHWQRNPLNGTAFQN
jgi:hypothetical protein